jgi:hypothetical protein
METSLEEVSEANCVVDPYIRLIYEYSDYSKSCIHTHTQTHTHIYISYYNG